jgi:predicted XRE-type DNA-binding protein
MTMNYDNIINIELEASEQYLLDKKCSELMSKIHEVLDLGNAPIKTIVHALGVTPAQARNLVKGNIQKFSYYELQTFSQRLSSDIR